MSTSPISLIFKYVAKADIMNNFFLAIYNCRSSLVPEIFIKILLLKILFSLIWMSFGSNVMYGYDDIIAVFVTRYIHTSHFFSFVNTRKI